MDNEQFIQSIEYIYSFYKNQKSQLDKLDKIKNWFLEIQTSPKDSKTLLITGNTGIGKCLDKNTKILLENGFLTYLYNVNIGDFIMDPFGKSRKVLAITRGFVQGYYKITYSSIKYSYSVTPNHYLYLFNSEKNLCETVLVSNFFFLSPIVKSIYKGIDTIGKLYDLTIEYIQKSMEYIGIEVENNLVVLENSIITHNSNITNIFVKDCGFDIIDIGKLFDLYDTNSTYSSKEFVSKIVKQKNVNKFDGISKNKLLLIDSLEEYATIHKTIIRDLTENLENLKMPIVIVCGRKAFYDLEKKVKLKLKKISFSIELENPNNTTITNYLKTYVFKSGNYIDINKLINYCRGDLRNLNNMIKFQKLGLQSFQVNTLTSFADEINLNYKDVDLEFENTIKSISSSNISHCLIQCETDSFIFGMLTYQNYIYNPVKASSPDEKQANRKKITNSICFADSIEKIIFKYQQWNLLDTYIFFSTIYPWKLLETPKKILPSNTLQKFMNTKKRNKRYDLLF
jgi:hypothetical protein